MLVHIFLLCLFVYRMFVCLFIACLFDFFLITMIAYFSSSNRIIVRITFYFVEEIVM